MQSYRHFTPEERACLAEYLREGKRPSEIADMLDRYPSSVTREIKRNRNQDRQYNPVVATNRYKARRRKNSIRKPRLRAGGELLAFVCDRLEAAWSPEEIVLVWKKAHPGEKLSPGTIYRAVRKHLLPGIAARTHLRRRGKRRYGRRGRFNTIQLEHTIHERPEVVQKRERVGDWEGDTRVSDNIC